MSLENAPEHIKLAVDLIQLLEENQLPTETVLKALTIVQQDFQRKLETETTDATLNCSNE